MANTSVKMREYDAFEHLCRVVFPDDVKGLLMDYVTAYFDESYSHLRFYLPDKRELCRGGFGELAQQRRGRALASPLRD
jgi:hypothetical protein